MPFHWSKLSLNVQIDESPAGLLSDNLVIEIKLAKTVSHESKELLFSSSDLSKLNINKPDSPIGFSRLGNLWDFPRLTLHLFSFFRSKF